MRITAACVLTTLTLALNGCAFAPRIELSGSPADLKQLAGSWEGTYSQGGKKKGGTLAFTLKAADTEVEGEAKMVPEGGQPLTPYPPRAGAQAGSDPLTITFMRAYATEVTGTMDRYWDAERKCQAAATFRGAMKNNVLTGSFRSVCEDGSTSASGHWTVVRK